MDVARYRYMYRHSYRERERDRQTDRQTQRQTDRQRQTERVNERALLFYNRRSRSTLFTCSWTHSECSKRLASVTWPWRNPLISGSRPWPRMTSNSSYSPLTSTGFTSSHRNDWWWAGSPSEPWQKTSHSSPSTPSSMEAWKGTEVVDPTITPWCPQAPTIPASWGWPTPWTSSALWRTERRWKITSLLTFIASRPSLKVWPVESLLECTRRRGWMTWWMKSRSSWTRST